jgi:hypothetical protein
VFPLSEALNIGMAYSVSHIDHGDKYDDGARRTICMPLRATS